MTGSRFLAAFAASDDKLVLEAVALPERTVRSSSDLFLEGNAPDLLYILTEGWAYRYKTTRAGDRQIVALIVPGDIANLDTLMFGRADFGVRTLTEGKVVAIPCAELLAVASYHGGIAKVLTRFALIENAILSQWALCLGRMSAQQRLAHLLCELGERLAPERRDDGMSFDMPLTQEQVADTLGLTSVHVNRTLQHLRTEGLVETAGRKVRFPDVARLRDMADFDARYLHSGENDGFRPWPATA